MAHASFSRRAPLVGRRLSDPFAGLSRRIEQRGPSTGMVRETRAIRGALIGAMLSVPLWALALIMIYWLAR
jgi:hypothetical protein